MAAKIELSGRTFSKLKVLGYTESKFINGKKRRFYLCLCACGNKCEVRSEFLTRGLQKSCGCLRIRKGSKNPKWTGYGEISGEFWSGIKCNAKSAYRRRKGIAFSITIRYAWNLYLQQNRKCALSGILITFGDFKTASLDRIDSKKGYVKGNVQWIHKDLNIMKQSYSQKYFVEWCNLVSAYQKGESCQQNT